MAMAPKSLLGRRRRSKYRAVPVVIDGHRFPSKGEGEFYQKLTKLREVGAIDWFALQPEFILPGGIIYRADFIVKWANAVYGYAEPIDSPDRKTGQVEIIDFKGFRTPEYRLKKKLAASIGIHITEVTK
jgi:hypothetical protein